MTTARSSSFDALKQRMFERQGVETLPAHLEQAHGIVAQKLTRLDVGVFRVDRDGKPPVVARLFSVARPPRSAVEGDLTVLRYLADVGFRAERPFSTDPLSAHEHQTVLLTEFVRQAPRAKRPAHPIPRLGAMIGRLHNLDGPAGVDRRAGALHHFAEGTLSDELRSAAGWLESIADRIPPGSDDDVSQLCDVLGSADGGDGCPRVSSTPIPFPRTWWRPSTG